jgi:hypothetical protein
MRQVLWTSISMVGALLVAASADGQGQLSPRSEVEPAFLKGKSQFIQMQMGTRVPSKDDKELIDVAAKYYVHRFSWKGLADGPQELSKEYARFHAEFDSAFIGNFFNPNMDKKGNRALVEQMGPALVRSTKPVFEADILSGENRLLQANVAQLLPKMARLRQEELLSYLLELVNDPTKHDAIRVFALKGLAQALPVRFFDDVDVGEKKWEKQRERDVPYVDALAGFVEGTVGAKVKQADENVIRFMRREALESLSSVGIPAVKASNRDGKLLGAAAPTLLKVLSKKGLEPEPGLAERIEAAIGLCQMKYVLPSERRAIHEYQPELAVYLVGRLIHEFGSEYNKEWANLKPGPGHKPPSLPWKIHAKRLEYALKDLARNAEDSPLLLHRKEQKAVEKNAKRLEQMSLPILSNVYSGLQPENLPPFVQELRKTMRPSVKTAFRSLKSPEIDFD